MPIQSISKQVLQKKRRALKKDLTAYLLKLNSKLIGFRLNKSLLIKDNKGLYIFKIEDIKELLV